MELRFWEKNKNWPENQGEKVTFWKNNWTFIEKVRNIWLELDGWFKVWNDCL